MQSNDENSKKNVIQHSRPRLNNDLLLNVCEKFLFSPDNEYRMDLKNFSALNFMFASRSCLNNWYFQFRRLTKLYVSSGCMELHCPRPIEGRHGITTQPFFQGPFSVNDSLLLMLLQKGQLKVNTLESFYSFADQVAKDSGIYSAEEKTKQSSIVDEQPAESFIRLFLFRDSYKLLQQLPLESIEHCKLILDRVKITDNASAFSHLDRILNLNSLTIYIEFSVSFMECIQICMPIVGAERVEHIILIYTVNVLYPATDSKDFPFDHFYTIINFVLSCCPNLKRLYIRVSLDGEFNEEEDFDELSKWLYHTIQKIATTTLVGVQCNCDLTIDFRAFFPSSTLQKAVNGQNELTLMGQMKTLTEINEMIAEEDMLCDVPAPCENYVPAFTIARLVVIDDCKKIIFALKGVDEDNTVDNWAGFAGAPLPVLLPFNGFESDDDED